MSPTQRSLASYRKAGWLCAIVEKWNAHMRIRQDLWGFADILVIRGNSTLLIQTTSGSNVSARLTKLKALPAVRIWLESDNRRLVVHGWAKRGGKGKAKRWTCREIELTWVGDGFCERDTSEEIGMKTPAQQGRLIA